MNRTKIIATTLALMGSVGVANAQSSSPNDQIVRLAHKVTILGCHAEDSCRIDYKGSGSWVIVRDRRH